MAAALSSVVRTAFHVHASRPAAKRAQVHRLVVRAEAEPASTEAGQYLRSLPGISQPFPNVFDPLGLSKDQSIKELRRWRESELTHGRVAMLAALGFVVGEQLIDSRLFLNFDGGVTGPAINHFQQTRFGFKEILVLGIGIAESYRVAVGWNNPTTAEFYSLRDDYAPGDLGFDPLNLKPTDPKELYDLQTRELNNGRLAMIAIAAFVAQELVDHQAIFEHLFDKVGSTGEVANLEKVPQNLSATAGAVKEGAKSAVGQLRS